MRSLFIILGLLLLCVSVFGLDINVTPASIGTTYIEWQWDAGYNLTSILIDGTEICGYETTDNTIIRSGFTPSSLHMINVTNGTFYGSNTTMTLPSSTSESSAGDDGSTGVLFGVAGGIVGSIIILRREKQQ